MVFFGDGNRQPDPCYVLTPWPRLHDLRVERSIPTGRAMDELEEITELAHSWPSP
jgi:hypothetical protein